MFQQRSKFCCSQRNFGVIANKVTLLFRCKCTQRNQALTWLGVPSLRPNCARYSLIMASLGCHPHQNDRAGPEYDGPAFFYAVA